MMNLNVSSKKKKRKTEEFLHISHTEFISFCLYLGTAFHFSYTVFCSLRFLLRRHCVMKTVSARWHTRGFCPWHLFLDERKGSRLGDTYCSFTVMEERISWDRWLEELKLEGKQVERSKRMKCNLWKVILSPDLTWIIVCVCVCVRP